MNEYAARPAAIDALRAEFERVAEREAIERRARWRPVALAFAALLVVTATAYAAGLLPVGRPLPSPPRGDVPVRLLPRPGTAAVDQLRVPDPTGGPPWGVRISTSRAGLTCYAFGRVQDRQLGIVDAEGRFRPLPLAGTGSCGDLTMDPIAFDIRRVETRSGHERTLVGGVAGREVTRIVAARPGPSRTLVPTRAGAFLVVYEGAVPLSSLRLTAYFEYGKSRQLLGLDTRGRTRG
jgi:hypothetical protein